MALHDPTDQLTKLVRKHTKAAESDILAGVSEVVNAVAELASSHYGENGLSCEVDEAAALVRASVRGEAAWVGKRIFDVVTLAIYEYVLPRAEAELAQQERNRRESADELRIERAQG